MTQDLILDDPTQRPQPLADGFPDAPPPSRPIYHLKRENNARRRNAMTFSCLGKIAGTGAATLGLWKAGLGKLFRSACRVRPVTQAPLVIGLAESGIIPSALFHQVVREACPAAAWICSTRRPSPGIAFSEHHSHAPDHSLPDPEIRPTELWFVEDEITTGRTLLGLSLNLCRRLDQRRVRYVAFTDARSPEARRRFDAILSADGIRSSLHVLFPEPPPGTDTVREEIRLSADPAIHDAPQQSVSSTVSDWLFPASRPALGRQVCPDIPLPTGLTGSLLAVGEAVDLGVRIVLANPGLQLRHVTLSPWEVDDVHIHNRLDIPGDYYLYNPHTLRPPLYILNDPVDAAVGLAARERLEAMGFSPRLLAL
ncbi:MULTISPECIES: phosphoribosyltransferase domain-containing protein [Desulfococcus]|uniref:Orotate phosphoribosyltransferase-like domain-containing protein n=1 Tax=Desulfococcus multivorans DSM 2059 TaxID=1121405 RepID=S7UPT3_DESML|nr:phosphoribosyltransferase domain-containing protein [Desulfococcus multivorans]AOY60061.1 uncharacterized protein Dmul_32910 [Desulfococcus multivorans]AQV02199.1 hypothetical protein B2D07_16465 [Desulfococcus multivorans]EPR36054.1 hypothetical protein dsmv_0759 [Desulfococcus multivorans DSM 2059]SJZ37639.1 Phosphoribosyl transferase [Desulfococcus multivorans DSM 2059]